MAPKILPPAPPNPVNEQEPRSLGLTADYRQWISFEGCCSPATELAVERKLPGELEAERSRALKTHLKTLQGGE